MVSGQGSIRGEMHFDIRYWDTLKWMTNPYCIVSGTSSMCGKFMLLQFFHIRGLSVVYACHILAS